MKIKPLFAVFSVGTILAVILRIVQLLQMTDPETGFYYPQYKNADTFILASIAAVIIIILLLARLSDGYPKRPVKHSVVLGVASVVLSVVMLVHCVEYAAMATGASIGDYIYILLGLCFAAFLMYYGVCLFMSIKFNVLTSIIPVIFSGYRLAITFIKYTGIAKIPDVILDVIMLGLCMVFWHFFGKVIGEINFKKSVKWAYGAGLCASLVCIVCAVPKYFIDIFMAHTTVHSVSSSSYLDLAVSIFIIIFLIVSVKKPQTENKKLADEIAVK